MGRVASVIDRLWRPASLAIAVPDTVLPPPPMGSHHLNISRAGCVPRVLVPRSRSCLQNNGRITSSSGEKRRLAFMLAITCFFCVITGTVTGAAEWNIITHSDMDSNTTTSVAIIENEEGYTLEIYKDSVESVRARFTLVRSLISFPENFCPTFQIDIAPAKNRSINDAPCLSGNTWAEFILGYVENGRIDSSAIAGLMNGVGLRFRFLLVNGDYRETLFSLRGSKRAISEALNANTGVSTPDSN